MQLVTVEGVKKDYTLGKTTIHALRGLDFSVETGEFLSIVGPSGCGKTTLLNLIGCIDTPTAGRITFEGTDVAGLNDNEEADMRPHKIGFIFQSFNLIPVLTVTENVEFPMILTGTPKEQRKRRAAELLEAVELSEYADHKPDELSGGQRQRVAIARALVHKPRLVIADEPTANLDSETSRTVMSIMQRLNEREKVTFIFSTHNPLVIEYAHRIIELQDGLIKAVREGERV
ncbi:MAG: ABC transporter ATP-binding protein [Spirochaetota bacterium]|nr:ABC transporter ATP-binding protein [Spirochaetota bacterium]